MQKNFHTSAKVVALGAVALVLPALALAQTATDSFDVTITIQADCEITSTATLDFGTQGVLTTAVDEQALLEVTCTEGTDYDIGLDAGTGTGATTSTRLMTGGADTVAYQIFQNAGRSINWGNVVGTDTQASTGTGTTQPFAVYGRVPVQTTPAVGTYTDTVGVTVTF